MDKHRSNFLIIISLLIAGVVVYFGFRPKEGETAKTPIQTPRSAVAQEAQSTTVLAPDGKMSMTMRKEGKNDVVYTFSTKDEATGIQKQVFQKTVSADTTLSIPLNTFSPDDKYFFLKESGPSGTTYFVPMGDQVFDIPALFAAKYDKYKITDVTGWGGMTLIVVNTDKISGGEGPSFWFDVTNKSFVLLSNRFN